MVIAMTMAAITQPSAIQKPPQTIQSRLRRREIKDIAARPRLCDTRPAHNCFGFHTNFTCNLVGVTLLEFWQEEFHGERAGISFF